jgi:hypothetical protein
MPGVKVFTDVSLNFNKTDYITTLPEAWKDEGHFVAANAAALLYRRFSEVGLSFFPDYVRKQVKAQGWNEEEDRPVTAGEEELNRALRPYSKDSAMSKMFDFSKMEDTPLKQDLQNPGQRPAKNSADKDSPANPKNLHLRMPCLWQTSRCTTMQTGPLVIPRVKRKSLLEMRRQWVRAGMTSI